MGKKINAFLGMATAAALIFHVVYQVIAYQFFYYNPAVSKTTSHIISMFVVLHVICSGWIFIKSHDLGNGIKYAGLNARTIVQRITAVLMLILIGVHASMFSMLPKALVPLLIVQILFFACVFTHVGVSASNALITFGRIESSKGRKRADVIACIICAVLFIAASIVITKTEFIMFTGGAA